MLLIWRNLFLGVEDVKQPADRKMEKSEAELEEFDEEINRKCNSLLEISRKLKFIVTNISALLVATYRILQLGIFAHFQKLLSLILNFECHLI